MGLRDIAAADFRRFTADTSGGFGWPMVLIAPDGTEHPVNGFTTDINLQIDPQTGQTVSGRAVSMSVSFGEMEEAGITDRPYGVTHKAERPWLARIEDITGESYTLKMTESHPDRAIGALAILLEGYDDGT